MPVDFQQIRTQVKEMALKTPDRQRRLDDLRTRGRELLAECAGDPARLAARLEKAIESSASLRCAKPAAESIDLHQPPAPSATAYVLLAADGSQVNPSRHDAVEFGVINVGAIRLNPGSGETPSEYTQSELLYHDAVLTPQGMVSEETVALNRDLKERRFLADLAEKEHPPVITLTDGPLEFYREPRDDRDFQKHLEAYLDVLARLGKMGAVTAGYVDRPRADLVVRLLELVELPEERLSAAGRERPLGGVADADLFSGRLLPGERSAIFAIQSRSSAFFKESLALHFFYLNVGRADHPYLARVEIPAWVASSEPMVRALHLALLNQCAQFGTRPYPYALHRSHEIAVVSLDEKQQLESMIAAELLRAGLPPAEKSNKQAGKDLPGKTRHKP